MRALTFPKRACFRRRSTSTWSRLCFWVTLFCLGAWPLHDAEAQKLPTVTITGDPVAPNPRDDKGKILPGTGLCAAFRLLGTGGDPNTVFKPRGAGFPNSGATDFPDSVNAFMDGTTGGPMLSLIHI